MGIMILLNAAGYSPPVGGLVKSLIVSDDASECAEPPCFKLQNIQSSAWYILILAALALAVTVGVVAGFLTSTPSISYLIAGALSLFLGLFMIDLVWIYTKVIEHGDTWMVFLMTAIFAPLVIGFIITAVEWWQGVD